jgi:hypothetical protein
MQQTIEMTEFNKNKQIHCKLTYNDQIRRFIFNGTEFTELRGHISNLLSLPADGFVLKYVDNETDLITITCNEDLALALDISDKILRLVVENPTSPAPPISPSQLPVFPPGPGFHGRGGRGCGRRGGHHHYGGMHGGYHGGHHGGRSWGCPQDPAMGGYWTEDKKEKAKIRIQSKIESLKSGLDQLPEDDWRRQHHMMKINRLEGRLLRWDALHEKKMEKKICKKQHKEEKKWDKKISPEAMQQIQALKTQIATLKPVVYQLKLTKKAKKNELELSLQTGQGDKEAIWNELLRLKESIHDTQKQISSLKDQIHEIRG